MTGATSERRESQTSGDTFGLMREIERLLNSESLRENLALLFIDVLHWAAPQAVLQPLQVGVPVKRTLTLIPIAQLGQVPVYRHDWESEKLPTLTQRRAVHRALSRVAREHLLCYVAADGQQVSFVRGRLIGQGEGKRSKIELRSLPYEAGSPARTTIERLAELAFSYDDFDLFDQPRVTAVTDKLDRAFDVEAVTREFFEGFRAIFDDLWKRLEAQSGDRAWAHDYALQLLNRMMFLYFIQRKRWLGDDANFLSNFWNAYKASSRSPNTFFADWLSALFFEAFCNRFQEGRQDRQYVPQRIREALGMAPFLNGGLFTHNKLDEACADYLVTVRDELFVALLDSFQGSTPGLFQRYNFTISESTPFDQEVAVDPVMIGKVYESLVNVSEEAKERGEAGIFYTPRVEIDLMCRLSLVDWLANHLGAEHKDALYEAVFAYEYEDKIAADQHLAQANLWPRLDDLLRKVTVLDPACGSGSFLVGMLSVLADLLARADDQLDREESPYERKKRIIGRSLYGVDVMDWAVATAELRLWLQLVIDTELKEIEAPEEPLLPNLTFHVRPGDSLVQEIGGLNLALRGGGRLPYALTLRIEALKAAKRRFYLSPSGEGPSSEEIKLDEITLFRKIIAHQLEGLGNEVRVAMEKLGPPKDMLGQTPPGRARQLQRVQELEQRYERLKHEYAAIRSLSDVRFVWDIAFVELLEDDRVRFDVVIGNPPYVRQERIHDPKQPPDQVTVAEKRAYKAKLANSIYAAWPHSFGYDWRKGKPRWKLDARSDLYIYFYLHGLSLLSEKGAFCFITSNSWLDVGYGRDLQRFLLTRGEVKLVIDNQARRSFAESDVNTVIVLLGAPQDTPSDRKESLEHTARFVMLTVPFEEVLDPIIWEEVVEASDRRTTPEFRVHPARQADLLASGMDPQKGRYTGDKWGGKYLRAPDIYWTILEKGKGKLVRLGDIAEVRFGIKTGANQFFYLDKERIRQWGIGEGFLRPVIKSPRECRSIVIDPRDLKYKLFMCHKDKEDLAGTAALDYIEWGETRGFDRRPSCRGRKRWWAAGLETGNAIFVKEANDSSAVFYNPGLLPVDCRLYCAHLPLSVWLFFNSSIAAMLLEIYNRAGLGEGARSLMVEDYKQVPCFREHLVSAAVATHLLETVSDKPPRRFEVDTEPAWRALDDIIFDVLGLTQGERDAVYEAVINLVEARLSKARSLKRRR